MATALTRAGIAATRQDNGDYEPLLGKSEPGVTYHATASVFQSNSHEPIAEYEGRHRYDPQAEWTEKEERDLVRKVLGSVLGPCDELFMLNQNS